MSLSSLFHFVVVVLLVAAIFTVQLGLVTAGIYAYSVIFNNRMRVGHLFC